MGQYLAFQRPPCHMNRQSSHAYIHALYKKFWPFLRLIYSVSPCYLLVLFVLMLSLTLFKQPAKFSYDVLFYGWIGETKSFGFNAKIEQDNWRRIASAVFPISKPITPERPIVPMTSKSIFSDFTRAGMTLLG